MTAGGLSCKLWKKEIKRCAGLDLSARIGKWVKIPCGTAAVTAEPPGNSLPLGGKRGQAIWPEPEDLPFEE